VLAGCGVYVRVVDLCIEHDFRGFERVVLWEFYVEEEDALRVGRTLWAHDHCLPVEEVVVLNWAGAAIIRRVSSEIYEFFLDSFDSHISENNIVTGRNHSEFN
jgi:hypothetical protein